jgi:hypothetical protein
MPEELIPGEVAGRWARINGVPLNETPIESIEPISIPEQPSGWIFRNRTQSIPEPIINNAEPSLPSSEEHEEIMERMRVIIRDSRRVNNTPFYDTSIKKSVPFPDFFGDKRVANPKIIDTETIKEIKLKFKYIPISISEKQGFIDIQNNCIYNKEWRYNSKIEKLYYTKSNIKNNIDDIIKKHFDINSLNNNCSIFVKDYIKSSKLFQLKEKKRVLVGKRVSIVDLSLLLNVKRSENKESIIRIKVNGEDNSTRFHIDDLDIVYPNFNGYLTPKDRTIKIGSNVTLVNDKFIKTLKKGEKYIVDQIVKNGNKVYAYITPNHITDKQELVNVKKLKVI